MIDALLRRAERRLGAPLDYLRHLARHDRTALAKFALFLPLAGHRRRVPADVLFASRLAATRAEDCGTCVQIVVNEALQAGVDRGVVCAVLDGPAEALPDALADAVAFGEAVGRADEPGDALRGRLRARHGDAGLAELALAAATARVFPAVKRGLGYATSCSLVTVEV